MYMLQFKKQNTQKKAVFENIYCYTVIINVEYKYIGDNPKINGFYLGCFRLVSR